EQSRITAPNHIKRAVQHAGRRIERAVGVQRGSELEVRTESRYRGERRCNLSDRSRVEQTVGIMFGEHFAFQGRDDESLILSAKPKRCEAVSVSGDEGIHRRRLSRIEVRNSR